MYAYVKLSHLSDENIKIAPKMTSVPANNEWKGRTDRKQLGNIPGTSTLTAKWRDKRSIKTIDFLNNLDMEGSKESRQGSWSHVWWWYEAYEPTMVLQTFEVVVNSDPKSEDRKQTLFQSALRVLFASDSGQGAAAIASQSESYSIGQDESTGT